MFGRCGEGDMTTMKVLAWWDGDTRLYVSSGPVTDAQLYIPHSWRLIQDAEETPDLNAGAPPTG